MYKIEYRLKYRDNEWGPWQKFATHATGERVAQYKRHLRRFFGNRELQIKVTKQD